MQIKLEHMHHHRHKGTDDGSDSSSRPESWSDASTHRDERANPAEDSKAPESRQMDAGSSHVGVDSTAVTGPRDPQLAQRDETRTSPATAGSSALTPLPLAVNSTGSGAMAGKVAAAAARRSKQRPERGNSKKHAQVVTVPVPVQPDPVLLQHVITTVEHRSSIERELGVCRVPDNAGAPTKLSLQVHKYHSIAFDFRACRLTAGREHHVASSARAAGRCQQSC